MNLIILGAPGSGKGTQAARIAKLFGIPAISTGDIFRTNIANGTELGRKAKLYMDHGELVPDEIVIAIALDRLERSDCSDGFLLDGFPRTTEQADALFAHLDSAGKSIDKVILIEVPTEKLVHRMTGRRICRACGVSYHVTDIPPAKEGLCDLCGGELYKRGDDETETAANRIEIYNSGTAPLANYYSAKGLLARIAGTAGPDAVFADILGALGK